MPLAVAAFDQTTSSRRFLQGLDTGFQIASLDKAFVLTLDEQGKTLYVHTVGGKELTPVPLARELPNLGLENGGAVLEPSSLPRMAILKTPSGASAILSLKGGAAVEVVRTVTDAVHALPHASSKEGKALLAVVAQQVPAATPAPLPEPPPKPSPEPLPRPSSEPSPGPIVRGLRPSHPLPQRFPLAPAPPVAVCPSRAAYVFDSSASLKEIVRTALLINHLSDICLGCIGA